MTRCLLVLLTLGAFPAYATGRNVEFVPGEYVVRLKSSIQIKSIATIAQSLSMEVKEIMPTMTPLLLVQTSVVLKEEQVLKTLMENPIVENAERNFIYRAMLAPNDKEYSSLWGLKNSGQMDSGSQERGPQEGVVGVDIDAERAWDITTGSQDIVVGVIDSGIDLTQTDLKNNLWVNTVEATDFQRSMTITTAISTTFMAMTS